MKELKDTVFPIEYITPKVTFKVFEDNIGALDTAMVHKHLARNKHINMQFHHFREYMTYGEVTILPIGTMYQTSDYLTKEVSHSTLDQYRLRMQGW